MRVRDLHELPKLRDGLSYLYLEHCIIDRKYKAVEAIDKEGRTQIPAASLAVLLLGPGTSITHEAVKTLTDNGCLINWCGEYGVRFYAQGVGETRKGYKLLRQAELVSDPDKRLAVVRRMYEYRFDEALDPDLSLQQIRGMEGARVRRAYTEASRRFNVPWYGRSYDRFNWAMSDPVNRALSAANACLNGICHAAIVSAGYATGLGFIHTGKQLSFVYDVADLYKSRLTVPLAFQMTSESIVKVESRVRHACRDIFYRERLLDRVISDMDMLLNLTAPMARTCVDLEIDFEKGQTDMDQDPALPGGLWDPEAEDGMSAGGQNYDDNHS